MQQESDMSDTKTSADSIPDEATPAQSDELNPAALDEVSGGINPQPLPPGRHGTE
jgi:hypothetical protein